ncbi:methylated-DNA--[protein]-cysteine S-methyltransferase [Actinokineospora bangkokensis]|uniref:methylated-DNA--[protein]-cysteine S-methyltransferase n=1 Tax=Actinokineospora bangkokensis TaxID=1193682 RepID=A0A1Q9LC83_9PSEU|nr:methylated-DNA--[protein]-cysteine S-methyltransferase [Actinokineospora bangkokensis]OLR89638.1 cysteine methyltransferase [Actinokineospora bangkokensis]
MFDTALGWCGMAWGERGVVAVELPGADRGRTLAALRRRVGGREVEPAGPVLAVVERVRALLTGVPDDLTDVPVDPSGLPDFHWRVYQHIRTVGPGRTTTYGQVAAAVGAPGSAQAVGQAMGANPYPIIVPCHRVLGAGGKVGGFSAAGGAATKVRILGIEGAAPGGQPSLFD